MIEQKKLISMVNLLWSDYEFDTLESELVLKYSYKGTHHQKSYTIKHPFIMSLSKIQ